MGGEHLPWPLYTIDFEASSLDDGTYPIEVGVCRWVTLDRSIEGWSSLIKPIPEWIDHGSWSLASAEVHRISREDLELGMSPTQVIAALNTIIGEAAAFCDGGAYDFHWARMLARASGIRATFKIGDFDHLASELEQLAYMRFVRWLDRAPTRHRARDDAERLMKALARGLRLEHGTSETIELPGEDANPCPDEKR